MALSIVKAGTWLRHGSVESPVDVITLDYDWWYSLSEADGLLDQDDEPLPLNADGCLYYVRIKRALEPDEPTWPDSFGHSTLIEAMQYAETKVGRISWSDWLPPNNSFKPIPHQVG